MTEPEELHPDDVQHHLKEVQDLLARQKVVEGLVHRQDMPRHELVENLVGGNGPLGGLRSLVRASVSQVTEVLSQLADSAPDSPLNRATTATRTFAVASISASEVVRVAAHYRCTRGDVELAIITGVLRRWMLSFTYTLAAGDSVRVVLPLGDRAIVGEDDADVDCNTGWFGEDGPGFVSHTYNLPIEVAAEPISQRWLRGVPVRGMFGVPALLANRALAITVLTYTDRVEFAFLGDRGVLDDLPAMVDYTHDAFDELRPERDADGG